MAQPGTLERAAGGLGDCPQPAPVGSSGGEHLLSRVVLLFSVSLALKAIKWFFYLLLLLLLILFYLSKRRPVQPLPALGLWGGSAWQCPSYMHRGGGEVGDRQGACLTTAPRDLKAIAVVTEPNSSPGWTLPHHQAMVPGPSSPEPPQRSPPATGPCCHLVYKLALPQPTKKPLVHILAPRG